MGDLSDDLINWYELNKRDLPWRDDVGAYRIWISEVILQQTRVAQGLDYYYRFVEAFPTVIDLANASIDRVLKLWQGLGYYSRARNLHLAAQQVRDVYEGRFPSTYDSIRSLRGVGDYTAAAIASFAFGLPCSVVDGNVYRVLSRLFAMEVPIDSGVGRREFALLAQSLLDRRRPALYNQALMELGAICCTPARPLCQECPLRERCVSKSLGKQLTYPVKVGRTKVKDRYLYYFNVRCSEGLWLIRRGDQGVWRGLYEFPVIESETALTWDELVNHELYVKWLGGQSVRVCLERQGVRHRLSHISMSVDFYSVYVDSSFCMASSLYVPNELLVNYPVSRLIQGHLEFAD